MAINRVEVEGNDISVFKSGFEADFCPRVNVFIGGNGTGKTTLLKAMYHASVSRVPSYREKSFNSPGWETMNFQVLSDDKPTWNYVFIPEKDILEHSKGLLTFIEEKQNSFGEIYKDVLIKAIDSPLNKITQESIIEKIHGIIHGKVRYDQGNGLFYTLRDNGDKIWFPNEASGYKKFGYLGLLVECGQLESGSVLFWDEPENSLNPELVSVLVDILLELSRNGVQIFIATHSEILCGYFAVNRDKNDSVMFHSLYKDGENIKVSSNDRFDLLEPNKLTEEPVKLYEKKLDKVFGNE